MTQVVKNQEGQIFLISKGADQVMIKKVNSNQKSYIKEEIEDLSREGLRTLVYAFKRVDPSFWDTWAESWKQIKSQSNLKKEQHLNLLEANQNFICITSVEDKLQPNVYDTVQTLLNASLKFWILTGDKTETVQCIAISIGLKLQNNSFFYFDKINHLGDIQQKCQQLQQYNKQETILVIDGNNFENCIKIDETLLFGILLEMKSVIISRCSPLQKTQATLKVQ